MLRNHEVILKGASVRFVGYVPVDRPIQNPPKDQLCKPPADFPDPLLEDRTINVGAEKAQPMWITVAVPPGAQPGLYRGTVRVSGKVGGQQRSAEVPVAVRVYDVRVGPSRLWVTNWFSMRWRHMKVVPEPDSPEYWALLRRYARNMAEHRQNVAKISPLSLASFSTGNDGNLQIDFSRFDRWVTIFIEEGVVGRIEGGHFGGRSGGWTSSLVIQIRDHWRNESPFTHTTPPHPGPPYLPAGDAWIVCPGRDGPLDSIRRGSQSS